MGTVTLPELRMRRASSGAIGWSINGTKETLGAGEEPGARQAGTQPDCTSLRSGSVPTQHSPRPHQCSAGTQRGSCCPPGSTPAAPSIPHHPSTTRCRSVPTKTSRPLIPSCSGGPRPRAHRCHTQSLGRPAGAALLSPEQRRNHAASHLRPTQCPLCAAASPPGCFPAATHSHQCHPLPALLADLGALVGRALLVAPAMGREGGDGGQEGAARPQEMLGVRVHCRERSSGALGQSGHPKRASLSAPSEGMNGETWQFGGTAPHPWHNHPHPLLGKPAPI